MDFEFSIITDSMPALIEGAKLTWIITLAGLSGGIVIGIAVGLGRLAGTPAMGAAPHGVLVPIMSFIRYLAAAYVGSVRGTPIIVQVMFIYFALPMLIRSATDLDRFRIEAVTAAIVTLIINAGAYIAEIVRGAVLSIDKGQVEAGMALGISRFNLLAHIVGPIAFRRMIPSLGNQFIISLKDTSLFIVIGVGELTRQGQEIMATNFRALEIWTAVALLYLVMTSSLAFVLRLIEKRMRIV